MKPAFDGQLAAQISKHLQQQFAPLNNTFTGTLSPQDMAAIKKMSGFQQPRQERLSEKAREANIEAFNEQLALNAKTMGEVFVQNTKDKPIEEQYRAFQQAQEALKNQYANLSEEQLGIALTAFNEQADVFAKADKEAGFFARTGDALSYIPTTATKLGEQLTGLFSPDGSARQWFADATNEVESWRSDEAKLRALQSADAMAQAKARGELGFTQFFSNAADNPLETIGQFVESALPTAGSALIGAAAAPITGGASLALPFVVGGVQGAGSARNEIHDHIMAMPEAQLQQNAQYQTLLAKGLNPEQARAELAGSFAEHGGEVLATGLSSAVLSGLGGLGRIGQVGKGVMGSTAGKFASELVTEPTDEVFQQFMANKAIRDVDATHSLTDGLGEAAAGGLLFGAAGGAVAAADNIYRTPSAESVQQQSDGVVENIVAQGNAEPPQPTVQQTAQPQQAVENPQNVANQPIQAEVELQQSENIAPTQPSVEVDNEADVTNLEPNIETENNPKQTLQNGTRYSLNESNDSDFIRSIEDISSGKRKGRDDRYLNMGTTPDVFKMIGLPDTKVSMRESVIDKVTQGKHKIDIDDFKQLPNQINNPIAVTKSRTRPNGYVVLTELNENVDGIKKPVIAALHLNKTNNGLEVVNIVSSYGRNISQLNEDIKESLYWNKTKGYPFARTVGLQLPSSLASVDNLSVGNIKTEADLSQYQSGKNTATPNQIEQDQATLSRILGEKTASHIQVVDSNTQVPTGQNVKKLAANGVEGWFDVSAQKLYIISDNITANEVLSRDERLAWVAFHELSHAGVRIKYGPILTNVLASAGKNVVVKVLTRKIQAEYGYTQEVAIEEAMAEIYAAFETGNWSELESRYKVKIHQSYKQGKDSVGDFLTKVANILRRLIGGIVGKDLTKTMTTSQVFDTLRGIQQGVNDIANTEQNQTASGDVRYSLNEEPNSEFARAVDTVSQGGNVQGYVNVGTTPDVLKMLGLPDVNVTIHGSTFKKVMRDKHNVTPETLKQLPKQINNPVAVMRSETQPNGYVMLTELTESENGKDKPVIAALHLKQDANGLELINIASVYGRSNSQIQRGLDNDLLYWNNEKGTAFTRTFGLQLPAYVLETQPAKGSQFIEAFGLQLPSKIASTDVSLGNDIKTEQDLSQYQAENSVRYSFAGRNAKTANHSLLEQAERDLASGKDPETIRQETGWFKGVDGKWRFEIDDSQISFKQNFDETDNALSVLQKSGNSNQPVATVGDILNAPELFAAYPDIAKINVVNSNDDYTAGGYSSDDFISLDSNLPVNKIKSTLLHELQHAIQNREQFAYGGSIDPRFIYVLQQELYENVEDSRLALQRLNGKYSVYTAFISKGKEAELKRKEFVIYRSVAKLRDYAYAENITRYRKHILDNVNLVHGLLLDIKNGKLSVTDKVRKTLSSIDGKTWNLPNQRSDDFPHALRVLALDTAEAFDSVIRNESRAEFDNDKRAFNTISRALDKAYDAVYDDAENARNVIRNAERQVRKAEALESKYGHHNASPYQIYTAMAGEVEARNVETRMNMTAEERLNRSPESTEDVRRDEQIVRYADGSIANSLNENPNSAFARAVTQVANGNVPNGRISMGTTPDVLKMLGLPDTEIRITGGIIQKVMSEYLGVDKGKNSHIHNLTPDTLKQLPQQMNNPVAVFRSSTKADAYVVLTELMEVDIKTGKEKPVVSALHINTGKGNVDVIDVRSVYGRGDNQLSTAFRDDLLYFNKTKGQQFLKTHPLQLHWDLTSDANLSSRNVKTEADLRQYQTENSNNDVRYSVKQSVADLAKTGKAKADQTFIDELKTKDYNGFKKRFDKAVGKLDEWVADGLRPVNDWIDNTLKDSGISAHEAERLKDNMYRAKGVRDALNSELEQAYLKPLLKKVAEVAKKHKLDELSAKRLIGYWASTRYAIEKNNEILAREHQAMLNAEKALNDAKAKGGDIEALSAEYRKAERQYRDRKHDVELALNSDEEFKVGTAGGWSNAEAQHIMENIEKHIPRKELELAVSYLYALNQRRLEIDHKAGRYTEEQYKEFRKNRHYVPLTGDPNADENFDGISGASQNAVNVSKDRALKGRKLSEAEDGIDASWRGINNSTTYAGWVDFKNSIDDIFENTVSELVGKGHSERSAREQAEKTLGISKQRMQGTTRSSDDVLIRKVGGIYYEYKLPQEVITALKNDNVENANAFLKVLSTPTSWYARGVTQWTITFAPMNMLRDTWEKSEFIRVQKLYDKEGNLLDDKTMDKIGRAVLKNAFYNKGTWKATKRMGFNQELRNEGDEALLKQLLELGGVSTYSTYLAKTETDLVKKVKTHNSYLGKKLEQAGSLLESYNKVFDTVSALAAFKAMLDHGVDAKQAAAKTLELTNFRKTGSKMRGIKALYMFSQPTAMGARNLIKYLSTPKGRNRFFGYMAVMMPLYLALRAMDDEDEGGNVMDQLGDITRYIPFPIGDGKYFKFPVGFGMPQMAWNFSVNTVKAIAGDISFTEAGTNMLVHSMKTFAPVSPSEISAAKFPLAKLTLTATPTILQPLMQNVLNRSAFGNQITTNFVVENKLKAEQSKSTTAQFWKDLAVGVNDTFGIDMHPEQIKNLFDGYGAMFGSLRELQTIFIENPNREQLGRRTRTPFLNQFIGTTNEFAVQSRYYEASEEARAFSTRYKSRKERGIMDELSPQDRAMLNWHNLNEKRMGELRAEKGKLTRALREKKINANVYEARIKAYNEKMDKTQRVFIKRWREMQGLNTH